MYKEIKLPAMFGILQHMKMVKRVFTLSFDTRHICLNIFHISCFQGLARNLEQPEVKDWLTTTKDQLMGDKGGKEKEEESKKINAILVRQAQILISFWLYNICLIFVLHIYECM